MKLTKRQIEDIIVDEIEVDCYDEYEANMGWAIYMEEADEETQKTLQV